MYLKYMMVITTVLQLFISSNLLAQIFFSFRKMAQSPVTFELAVTHRSSRTSAGHSGSHVARGVPQGSLLGPFAVTLFVALFS